MFIHQSHQAALLTALGENAHLVQNIGMFEQGITCPFCPDIFVMNEECGFLFGPSQSGKYSLAKYAEIVVFVDVSAADNDGKFNLNFKLQFKRLIWNYSPAQVPGGIGASLHLLHFNLHECMGLCVSIHLYECIYMRAHGFMFCDIFRRAISSDH